MSAETLRPTSNHKRGRGLWFLVRAVLPVAVWLSAIAAAFFLYGRVTTTTAMSGYAQDAPVTLAHPEPGVIWKVHVQLYEQVRRGQVLVSMDDGQERILLSMIQKDIDRLRAEVDAERVRVLADNVRAKTDVADLARRFVVDRETARIDYLCQLAANACDHILLRGSLAQYQIERALYDEGTATFEELNEIETQTGALKAGVEKNAEVLERKKEAFEKSDRRWIEFVQADSVVIPYQPVLAPLRLAIDVRQRDLEEVVRQIDAHVLRSPLDGQVVGLLAHAGDHVEGGVPLITVSPTFTDKVVAYLPEQMALAARLGAPVSVTAVATAAGQRRVYAGTIISLSATVGEKPLRYRTIPNYPVWGRGLVVALNDAAHLIPGEAVKIALLERQ